MKVKTIKVTVDDWKELTKMKIDENKQTLAEVISILLKKIKQKERAERDRS